MAVPTDVQRRLVAVFAADVEGYSRLMGVDEVGTLKSLTERRAILDATIARHRGRIANTAGDSVLAEFGSAVDAVQCAVEAQATLAEANVDLFSEKRINFRIGIHVGDVMVRAGDLFGDGVNIAARLQTLAQPGGVCVSSATYEQVRKVLQIRFADLGLQRVKNIEEPIQAYAATTDENATATPRMTGEMLKSLPLPKKPSIAVLAFANLSGDPGQDYFADGIADEILTALSRFRELFVIARTSSFTYKGRNVDVKQIGRELGVRYVLEGSVRKAGGRVRITGQLIDAASGVHIWTDRFEGGHEDIFALQDNVASAVVGAVAPTVEQAEVELARTKATDNLDAYDCYMKAAASIYRWDRKDIEEAERLLDKAIELDPEFASPYGIAAWCIAWRLVHRWIDDLPGDARRCGAMARRAVELAKDDAAVLGAAGYSLAMVLGALDEGIELLDRAVVLNPNLARAWAMSAVIQNLYGNPELAIEHNEKAMRLSPRDVAFHLIMHTSARACFYAGRYDEAIAWSMKAMRQSPRGHDQSLPHLIASCALTQRHAEAEAACRRLREIDPQFRISTFLPATRHRRPEDLVRLKEGLRLAGVAE